MSPRLYHSALIAMCLMAWVRPASAQLPTNSLELWLKADAGVVTTGTNVTQWTDQSGNNRHAMAAVGNPQLVDNELCGGPVIRFNGNAGMLTPAFQTFEAKRGTIFLVTKVTGGGGTLGFGTTISTYTGSGVQWQTGVYTANATYSWYDGVGSSGASISASPPNEWGILTYQRTSNTLLKFYKSGALAANVTVANNQASVNTLKIGFNDYAPQSEFLYGDIAELIVYNRSLSDEEVYNVNVYLANKYCFNSNVAVPTASSTSICGPGSVQLDASGGLNYIWYSSATDNTPIGNTASFTTPVLTETTTFYVANFNDTLESVRLPVTVTVNPLPSVSAPADAEVCNGDQVTLTASGIVGSIAWQPGGQTTASITVTPTSTQTYMVEATNGCGTATDAVTVTVSDPIVPTITQNGAVLSASASVTYQWYLDGTPIDGATSQDHTVVADGDYTVETTDANGCTATSTTTTVNITSTDQLNDQALVIYPNPSTGAMNLSTDATMYGTMLEFHDVLGVRVHTHRIRAGSQQIDLSHLPKGVYLVRSLDTGIHLNQRILIQ